MPFLLFLIYLGGFATKNSLGDMFLVLVFGALGWLMVKFEWQLTSAAARFSLRWNRGE